MSRATLLLLTVIALSGARQDPPTGGRDADADEPVVLWHETRVLLPTRVHHPPDFDLEREHMLIVAFHGYGSSAKGFDGTARALADMGFLVALPESGYAVSAGREPGFQWFPQFEDEQAQKRVVDLLVHDQVPALLEDLKARYAIDQAYTLGFSEGAVASMGSAIFLHEDFAGAVQFGLPDFSPDWLPGQMLPDGKDVRLLFLHGEGDARVPASISEETHAFFSDAGYETTLHLFDGGHVVPRDRLEVVADWIWQ